MVVTVQTATMDNWQFAHVVYKLLSIQERKKKRQAKRLKSKLQLIERDLAFIFCYHKVTNVVV